MKASALPPEVAQAAALAQLGRTRPEIAAEQGCSDRAVRRRLAAARAAGLATELPTAPPAPDEPARAATSRPAAKPALASVITLEQAPGYRSATFGTRRLETAEERAARTGGDGHGDLGRDTAPGEYGDPMGDGRRLVKLSGTTLIDTGPRADAVSGYYDDRDEALRLDEIRANAPPGATQAYDPETGDWIDL